MVSSDLDIGIFENSSAPCASLLLNMHPCITLYARVYLLLYVPAF